jgi:hypothetical protein
VTSSDPLVDLVPLHPPEAVHDVESEDDHDKVAVEPTSTETTSETKDAIFARIAGALPPPPPPPPHEVIIKSDDKIKRFLDLSIYNPQKKLMDININ